MNFLLKKSERQLKTNNIFFNHDNLIINTILFRVQRMTAKTEVP